MHLDMKQITNTNGLIQMANAGQLMDYNRQEDPERLKEILCEEGIHIELFNMIHEHKMGQPVEPHYRSMWMVMTKKFRKNPVGAAPQVTFDTPIKVYDKYVTTSDQIKSSEDLLDDKIMEALANG
jgi:hypothetical protein